MCESHMHIHTAPDLDFYSFLYENIKYLSL